MRLISLRFVYVYKQQLYTKDRVHWLVLISLIGIVNSDLTEMEQCTGILIKRIMILCHVCWLDPVKSPVSI